MIGQPVSSEEATDLHARAVEMVRNGDYLPAIDILARLSAFAPENKAYLHDHIAALSWAEKDAEALALEPRLEFAATPEYAASAVAKSARNLRAFEIAIRWYTRLLELAPASIDPHVGLALSLAEAGRYAESEAVFQRLTPEQRREPAVLVAQAYIKRLAGELIAAMHAYDQLIERNPNDFDALRGKALVLRDLLLPEQALELGAAHPGILTGEEIERLEVDALAIQLRLAAKTVYPEEIEGLVLDGTIGQIDEHLKTNRNSAAVLALKYDRIAALAERNEAEAAVTAFEELTVPEAELPTYVLAAAGKSYLQLQKPKRALGLLERAIAKPPIDIETIFALVYAYLDVDRYDDAMATARIAIDAEPVLLRAPDTPVVKGNDDGMRAEIVAAIIDGSVDRLDSAQARLEALLADSPNNSDVRHELANIYRWRGWLDSSLFQYDQVLTMDDSLVYARAGRAHTLLDAQQFAAVEAELSELSKSSNPDPVITNLAERWRRHNRGEMIVSASNGNSSGTTFGNNQYAIDAYWYSRPINYKYRAFAHLHNSFSEFPEGDARRRRTGAGVEYRSNRWTAQGEILNDPNLNSLGVAGNANWRKSDRWSISGLVGFNSSETQLRGYRANVESNVIGASATLSLSESAIYSFGTRVQNFSDNNTQQSLFGSAEKRLFTRPRSLTDLTAELSTTRNSKQDVAYFSPESDLGALVGLQNNWRILRRYDRTLVQIVHFQLGTYQQKEFGSGSIWRGRYAIEAQFSEALSVEFGIERSRNIYDGAAEYDTVYLATVQAKL